MGLKDSGFFQDRSEKYFRLSKLKVQDKVERREAVAQYLNVHLNKKEWTLLAEEVVSSYANRGAYFDTLGWLLLAETQTTPEEYASLFQEIGKEFAHPKWKKFLPAFKETWAQWERDDLLSHMQKGVEVKH